jgi:PPOX class probable F420-dependent enzyme
VSVRLDTEEALAFLAEAHTGILGTLRADGAPALTPLWFVVVDGAVCLRTLAKSAKIKHIKADPRVSFLVESGQAWAELKAVILYGTAELIGSPESIARIDDKFEEKYADYRMPSEAPTRSREHYASGYVHVRIDPTRRALTWDNSKLVS